MQENYSAAPVRKSGSGRGMVLGALAAFLLGAGGMGWLAWQGGYDFGLGLAPPPAPAAPSATTGDPVPGQAMAILPSSSAAIALEDRVNALEDKLTRLDLQAEAASGNAARAEGLLIALASRRAVERGVPLGLLEGQLRLRFGDAQPNAVTTLLTAAAKPVTLDKLAGDLDAMAPALANVPAHESAWQRVQRELAGLFVVRKEEAASAQPQSRFDRARLLVRLGRVEEAATEVERMPGAAAAKVWIDAARRYSGAQRALDQIETAALLEPRELKDAGGTKVQTPSPLTTPAAQPTPETGAAI